MDFVASAQGYLRFRSLVAGPTLTDAQRMDARGPGVWQGECGIHVHGMIEQTPRFVEVYGRKRPQTIARAQHRVVSRQMARSHRQCALDFKLAQMRHKTCRHTRDNPMLRVVQRIDIGLERIHPNQLAARHIDQALIERQTLIDPRDLTCNDEISAERMPGSTRIDR